jgi:Ser/Thr protein kinase RdoA (MazF antagonist)
MATKAQSEKEINLIPQVTKFFEVGNPIKIEPAKLGISNHNYFVLTEQGDFVVKFMINQKANSIENDVAIQKYLSKTGVKAPKYLTDKQGNYIFRNNELKVVISRRIQGCNPRNISTELAYNFGQVLANFHTHVEKLPRTNDKGLMNPELSKVKSDIFNQKLPKGIIHGDFHLGNALVDLKDKDRVVAMLDFEESGKNLYIVDLALTIMGTCSYSDDVMDAGLIRKIISGYEEIRQLEDLEKKYFIEAIHYTAEAWIKWFKENNYEKYAKNHQKRLETFMRLDVNKFF